MDSKLLYETIRVRRSERKFVHEQMTQATASRVQQAIQQVEPVDPAVRTDLRFYTGGEIRGYTPFSVAAFCEDTREGRVGAGYALEQMDLWFQANSFGSCWLGAAKPPADVPQGLVYAAAVCFGIPEGEPRTTLSQFKRKPLRDITDIPDPGPILETVRLAPSALNRQPWFFSGSNDDIIVLTKKPLLAKQLTDIDAGIALLYIFLAAANEGRHAQITLKGQSPVPKLTFQGRARITQDLN